MLLFTYRRAFKFSVSQVKKLNWLRLSLSVTIILTIVSCVVTKRLASSPVAQNQSLSSEWKQMTAAEQKQITQYLLNSPLGIAALNQVAIEGFISPNCPKTFYISKKYGGFQTLLQIKCNDERGISIASSYQEIRVIFKRFEDNIEDFEIQRIYLDK